MRDLYIYSTLMNGRTLNIRSGSITPAVEVLQRANIKKYGLLKEWKVDPEIPECTILDNGGIILTVVRNAVTLSPSCKASITK